MNFDFFVSSSSEPIESCIISLTNRKFSFYFNLNLNTFKVFTCTQNMNCGVIVKYLNILQMLQVLK